MRASVAHPPLGAGAEPTDTSLHDAREALAYWEDRARRLPRHCLRQRREAREMAQRWQGRVAEAERDAYGRGLLGALVLLAAERRLPEPTRSAGRRLARRTAQVTALFAIALVTIVLVAVIAVLEVLVGVVT